MLGSRLALSYAFALSLSLLSCRHPAKDHATQVDPQAQPRASAPSASASVAPDEPEPTGPVVLRSELGETVTLDHVAARVGYLNGRPISINISLSTELYEYDNECSSPKLQSKAAAGAYLRLPIGPAEWLLGRTIAVASYAEGHSALRLQRIGDELLGTLRVADDRIVEGRKGTRWTGGGVFRAKLCNPKDWPAHPTAAETRLDIPAVAIYDGTEHSVQQVLLFPADHAKGWDASLHFYLTAGAHCTDPVEARMDREFLDGMLVAHPSREFRYVPMQPLGADGFYVGSAPFRSRFNVSSAWIDLDSTHLVPGESVEGRVFVMGDPTRKGGAATVMQGRFTATVCPP
jgi:hypothetical protein